MVISGRTWRQINSVLHLNQVFRQVAVQIAKAFILVGVFQTKFALIGKQLAPASVFRAMPSEKSLFIYG